MLLPHGSHPATCALPGDAASALGLPILRPEAVVGRPATADRAAEVVVVFKCMLNGAQLALPLDVSDFYVFAHLLQQAAAGAFSTPSTTPSAAPTPSTVN